MSSQDSEWHNGRVSGGASSISKPNFLLEICDKIILRTATSFCARTTGRQLKQYPGVYMFITQPGGGTFREGLGVWIDVNVDRFICMHAGWLAVSQDPLQSGDQCGRDQD